MMGAYGMSLLLGRNWLGIWDGGCVSLLIARHAHAYAGVIAQHIVTNVSAFGLATCASVVPCARWQ